MLQLSFKGIYFLFLFIRKKAFMLLDMLGRVPQSTGFMTVSYSTIYNNMTSVNDHMSYEVQSLTWGHSYIW